MNSNRKQSNMFTSSKKSHTKWTVGAGRILLTLLIFKTVAQVIDAAPTSASPCSKERIQLTLDQNVAQNNSSDLKQTASDLYLQCGAEFLTNNPISPKVKETVDTWIGLDLGKANPTQLFLIYQIGLNKPKAENEDAEFVRDCEQMLGEYNSFRKNTEPLSKLIDIDMNSLLAGEGDFSSNELKVLMFAEYAQFCDILIH